MLQQQSCNSAHPRSPASLQSVACWFEMACQRFTYYLTLGSLALLSTSYWPVLPSEYLNCWNLEAAQVSWVFATSICNTLTIIQGDSFSDKDSNLHNLRIFLAASTARPCTRLTVASQLGRRGGCASSRLDQLVAISCNPGRLH